MHLFSQYQSPITCVGIYFHALWKLKSTIVVYKWYKIFYIKWTNEDKCQKTGIPSDTIRLPKSILTYSSNIMFEPGSFMSQLGYCCILELLRQLSTSLGEWNSWINSWYHHTSFIIISWNISIILIKRQHICVST